MTIPIIPGPFSFLREAGSALGAVATSKRERELQDRQEANVDLQTLMRQVELGILPRSILQTREAQTLFSNAGVALPGDVTPVPSIGEMRATRVSQLSGPRSDIALQVPTEEQTEQVTEEAALGAEVAGARRTAVRGGGAAGRTVTGVPTEEIAEAQEAAQVSAAEASQAQSETITAIKNEVSERLQSDDNFARWAAIADAGFLPLYLTRIQSSSFIAQADRQRKSDRFKLLFQPLEDSSAVFRSRHDLWQRARQSFITLNDPNEDELGEFDLRNPEPTVEDTQAQLLEDRALSLYPEAKTPEQAVRLYLDELNALTREVSPAIISDDRRTKITQAAQMVIAGSVTRQQVLEKLTDPIEIAEFEALILMLERRKGGGQ